MLLQLKLTREELTPHRRGERVIENRHFESDVDVFDSKSDWLRVRGERRLASASCFNLDRAQVGIVGGVSKVILRDHQLDVGGQLSAHSHRETSLTPARLSCTSRC